MEFRCHPPDFIPANRLDRPSFPYLSRVGSALEKPEASPSGEHLIFLAYELVPEEVWASEGRLVGVCQDCHLLWHLYRLRSRDLDAVVCPPQWEPAFRLAGIPHVVPVCLAGPTEPLTKVPPDNRRPIDLLVVGNLNPAIHPERVQALTALARLYPTWSVRIAVSLAYQDYGPLLEQSRFVLRIADENAADGLLFEATAAGAAVLQNLQGMLLPEAVLARAAVLPFDGEMKREELEAVLSDEEGRRALVGRAQRQTPWTYWEGLERALADLEAVLPRVRPRRDLPSSPSRRDRLVARVWQAMSSRVRDPHLVRDLEAAVRADGASAVWHNALGVALSRPERDAAAGQVAAGVASSHFRRATELDPRHSVAALNLVRALQASGDHDGARREAERALTLLDPDGPANEPWLDEPHAHYDFGTFRVEWEKAAWANASSPEAEGRAKRNLLCREFHAALAGVTGSVAHHYEAFLARPDLTPTVAALGQRLAQSENPLLALTYLTRAVQANPLDSPSAHALFQVLGRVGERHAQALFARDRLRLRWVAPGLLPAEPWAHLPPPADDERVSIVILCRNLAEVTRLCLESLLKTTDVAYELIVVDNGSDDETPELLHEYQRRAGPQRFVVVRNETNVGFARGCNQGMAEARGRYVVLLNNDVVLTPGWLRGLLRAMVTGWPEVAAVGPMTNYAPPPQRVAAEYDLADGLVDFARKYHDENAGRVLDVKRLTGFCLLVRREVLDRVGPLDDRFRVGFFEDDDLCIRIREAGWKLRVAQDVFVHHFGSKTFENLKIDVRQLLQENFKRFRNKWGEEHTRGYRLISLEKGGEVFPGIPVEAAKGFDSPPAAVLRPRITLSMIVRNEEKNLPDCLRTAADLFDEVVIADTGSSDRTREVAESFGARLVEFPWVDSFGAARNASLREVRTPWVMWLDADDRFDEDNRRKLKEVIAGLDERPDPRAIKVRSFMDPERTLARLLDQVRIFPNLPGVEWEYRIHEQILPSVRKHGGNVIWTDIVVDHVGYQFPEARRGKLERNLRLLELDYQERKEDPFTLFNLGWTKLDLGRAEEAYRHLKESLERTDAGSSIRRKLHDLMSHAAQALGKTDEAQEWLDKGLKLYPDDCELLLHRAELYHRVDDQDGAARCLEQVLAGPPSRYFASLDDGARGYRTRHRLAELYLGRGRSTEAEIQWRAALEERPQFVPAALGLGELLLSQGRWREVDEIAGRLERVPDEAVNAEVMRCRARMAKGEYAEARARLEELITAHPRLVGPRVLLTHVLLRQGEDWPAAEAHLLGVLELAPEHREARHNLDLLRQNHPHLRPIRASPPTLEVMTVCHSSRDPLLPAYVEHYLRANAAAVHLVLVGEDRDLKHLAGRERVHAHDLSRTPPEEMPVAIRELRDRLILRTDFLLVTETDEWLLPRFGTDLAGLLSAYLGEPVLGAVTYEVKPGPGDHSLDLTEPLPGQRSLGVRQDRDARPAAFGSKPGPRWRHQQMLVPFLRLRFGRSDSRVYQERRPVVPPLHPDEQAWEVWLATPGTVRIPAPGSWANHY